MESLEGNPISANFATGIAIVYDYEAERKLTLPDREIRHADVQTECNRFDDALAQSKRELKVAEQTTSNDPKLADAAALLPAHAIIAGEIAASVKQTRPSFDLQVYGDMAIKLAGLPMVIRTFDFGGVKLPPFLALAELRNRSRTRFFDASSPDVCSEIVPDSSDEVQ